MEENKPVHHKDSPVVRAAKSGGAKGAATARRHLLERLRLSRHVSGFMDFVREQGVVGLAVGLVLGVQVKALVDQLIASFVNPVLGLVLPGTGGLDKKIFTLTIAGKEAEFAYGAFIQVFISFLTVAMVVYFAIKALNLEKIDKKKS